jgi:hypothetical protein
VVSFPNSGSVPSRPCGESLNGLVMGVQPESTFHTGERLEPSQV